MLLDSKCLKISAKYYKTATSKSGESRRLKEEGDTTEPL